MNITFIGSHRYRRLILIFAGWAMDSRPFENLTRPGYDIAVVWNYSDTNLDLSFAEEYDEICLIAWSLGVRAAASGVLAPIEQQITLRLAVNGTTIPIDDDLGIPRKIFKGTRNGLCERSLDKFYRRVAGSAEAAKEFMLRRPHRSIESVAAELDTFLDGKVPISDTPLFWDCAIISTEDAIFPPTNQQKAWRLTPIERIPGAHLPEVQKIINKYTIDKDLTARRFAKQSMGYEAAAEAQRIIADDLFKLAKDVGALPAHGKVIEVGAGTGLLSRKLATLTAHQDLEFWDIVPVLSIYTLGKVSRGDAELLIRRSPDNSTSLIISASTLQWFNSPGAFLRDCARVLQTDGMIIIGTFGPDNIKEIKEATGLSLPGIRQQDWSKLIGDRLTLKEYHTKEITLHFAEPIDIFRHLKYTGVNSLGGNNTSILRKALKALQPAADGTYTITYQPVYCVMTLK